MLRLVYDNLEKPNALANNGIAHFDSLRPMLTSAFVPFTREEVECADKAATRFYVIQPVHFDMAFGYNCPGFIESISAEALSYLADRENGLKLLIFFPWEGYDLSHYEYVTIKYINLLTTKYGIDPSKILFCYGNLKIKEYLINSPIKLNLPDSNIIGVNIFNFIAYEDSNKFNTTLPDIIPVNRRRKFLFKNGVSRSHRMYLAGAIKHKNLLDKFYFSWLNHTGYDYLCHEGTQLEGIFSIFNGDSINKEYYDSFLKLIKEEPYILDITSEEAAIRSNQIYNNTTLYMDSYASLVTETVVDEFNNKVLFFSEKTYQPIYNFHPFINVSGQGVLEQLREEGFATFPELFDENYDNIEDAGLRVTKIIEEVEKFCNLDNRVLDDIYSSTAFKDKLIHNWHNFKSKGGQQEIRKLTNWLSSFNNYSIRGL